MSMVHIGVRVSIQPKPKKGLVEPYAFEIAANSISFNPAEAEEGFSRYNGSERIVNASLFQSSRSRRRV